MTQALESIPAEWVENWRRLAAAAGLFPRDMAHLLDLIAQGKWRLVSALVVLASARAGGDVFAHESARRALNLLDADSTAWQVRDALRQVAEAAVHPGRSSEEWIARFVRAAGLSPGRWLWEPLAHQGDEAGAAQLRDLVTTAWRRPRRRTNADWLRHGGLREIGRHVDPGALAEVLASIATVDRAEGPLA